MRTYVFKNKWYGLIVRGIDGVGDVLFGIFKKIKKPSLPSKILKILIVRTDHIGDVVVTTPLLRGIRAAFPDACISLCVASVSRQIVAHNPYVNEVIVFDAPWFLKKKKNSLACFLEVYKVIKRLRAGKFDVGIDPRSDSRNLFCMWLAGIQYTIGYGNTGLGFLLSHEERYVPEECPHAHISGVVRSLGVSVSSYKPEIFIGQEENAWVKTILTEHTLTGKEMLVGIHPHAGTSAKQWPITFFIQCMKILEQRFPSLVWVIVGGQQVYPLAQQIRAAVKNRIVDVTGKSSLTQCAALCAQLTLFVSNDSGPAHIAAAMGTPQIVIASGTNIPEQWFSVYPQTHIVQHKVSCAPCEKRTCQDHKCMQAIMPEEVAQKCTEILKLIFTGDGKN